MIDYHCHILPGLDDGARNLDESLEIARILFDSGFTEVYCTPHLIKGCFDNTHDKISLAVHDLQSALLQQNIALTLHAGVEYYLDEFLGAYLKSPLVLGSSTYVLVEAPVQANLDFVKENIYTIVRSGLVPLLAHPERCGFLDSTLHHSQITVQRSSFWNKLLDRFFNGHTALSPEQAAYTSGVLQAMGCRYQMNIGSFVGMYGDDVRKRAIRLLRNGYCYKLGTDAHSPEVLKRTLTKGLNFIEQEVGRDGLNKLVN